MRTVNFPIRTLVFSGGGLDGFAQLGALEALSVVTPLSKVESCLGSSSGAIVALLFEIFHGDVGLIDAALHAAPWKAFIRPSTSLLTGVWRLMTRFGYYPTHQIDRWLREMIYMACGQRSITFQQLNVFTKQKLVIMGMNVTKGETESFDVWSTPSMDVVTAVRISLSFPLLFEAQRYQSDWYSDGGILDNYPIEWNDYSETHRRQTLGLLLETPRPTCKIRYVWDFFEVIARLVHYNVYRRHLSDESWDHTICIQLTRSFAYNFSITSGEIAQLKDDGRRAVECWLATHDL